MPTCKTFISYDIKCMKDIRHQEKKSIKRQSSQSSITSTVDSCPIAFVCLSSLPANPYVPQSPLTFTQSGTARQQGHPNPPPPHHHPDLPPQPRKLGSGGPTKQRPLHGGVIPHCPQQTEVYLGL